MGTPLSFDLEGSLVSLSRPPPAQIDLPTALRQLVRDRELIAGTTAPGLLDMEDAQVLAVEDGVQRWVEGRWAALQLASANAPGTRFFPQTYRREGDVGFIAGVVQAEAAFMGTPIHFVLGVKQDDTGLWRIAFEQVTPSPRTLRVPARVLETLTRINAGAAPLTGGGNVASRTASRCVPQASLGCVDVRAVERGGGR